MMDSELGLTDDGKWNKIIEGDDYCPLHLVHLVLLYPSRGRFKYRKIEFAFPLSVSL